MKLASYKDGSRDGQLIVVSRDLKWAHYATGAATRTQHLLDDWGFISPQLQDIYDNLNQGRLRHAFSFDPAQCAPALPRAHAWARLGDDALDEPLFGPGDTLSGAREDMPAPGQSGSLTARFGFAAITGDVPMLAGGGQGIDGVRLLTLAVDVHAIAQAGNAEGPSATFQWRAAFGPVAVTPDELGASWQGGHVRLSPRVSLNGRSVTTAKSEGAGRPPFGDVVSALARHRRLGAGSIVGAFGQAGAESVVIAPGDRLRIEADDATGAPLFGSIELTVLGSEVAGA